MLIRPPGSQPKNSSSTRTLKRGARPSSRAIRNMAKSVRPDLAKVRERYLIKKMFIDLFYQSDKYMCSFGPIIL